MLKYFIPLTAAAMLMGCEAGVGIHPEASSSRQETAQLAAYAANTNYPTETKATWNNDWHVGAMTKGSDVKFINYTDRPINNVNIWVNGTYVHSVESIAPRSSVTVPMANFFDKNGHVMSTDNTPMGTAHFEIQSGNGLYSVMGPVAEQE